MKVCIIVPNIPENLPYINYYTDILDNNNVEFDILLWDRNHKLEYDTLPPNYYSYRKSGNESNNYLRKSFDFFWYSKFVTKHLSQNNYDTIIVCGIILAIYLKKTLISRYKFKYVFDIRDYSISLFLYKLSMNKLVTHSALNVISSEGYKKWLPVNANYILSHNIRKSLLLEDYKLKNSLLSNNKIEILTIGQLRDFESNIRIINAFGLNNKIRLKYSGDGLDSIKIQKFAKNNSTNCCFTGKYKKNDEHLIVKSCDFINVLLPEKDFVMTQMTNRFYLGILYRKPLIVNKKSIQYYFVSKYNLGFGVHLNDDLNFNLNRYLNSFDPMLFETGCREMIKDILKDIDYFENKIKDVLFCT